MSDNSVTQEEIKAINTAKPYDFAEHVSDSHSGGAVTIGQLVLMNEADKRETLQSKPVFTQEMADACKSVKVGMVFQTEAGEYCAALVNERSVCFEDENGWLVTMPIGMVKPVRTPKQKAVDEACLLLDSADLHNKNIDCSMAIKATVEAMISLGYKKC